MITFLTLAKRHIISVIAGKISQGTTDARRDMTKRAWQASDVAIASAPMKPFTTVF
jgi:hypothetical protein